MQHLKGSDEVLKPPTEGQLSALKTLEVLYAQQPKGWAKPSASAVVFIEIAGPQVFESSHTSALLVVARGIRGKFPVTGGADLSALKSGNLQTPKLSVGELPQKLAYSSQMILYPGIKLQRGGLPYSDYMTLFALASGLLPRRYLRFLEDSLPQAQGKVAKRLKAKAVTAGLKKIEQARKARGPRKRRKGKKQGNEKPSPKTQPKPAPSRPTNPVLTLSHKQIGTLAREMIAASKTGAPTPIMVQYPYAITASEGNHHNDPQYAVRASGPAPNSNALTAHPALQYTGPAYPRGMYGGVGV
jgi:hypothetical protein